MRRREFLALLPLSSVACAVTASSTTEPGSPDAEQVIATAQSDYNHVIVTQQGRLRRMYFEVADGRWLLQSTYDLDRPNSLDHELNMPRDMSNSSRFDGGTVAGSAPVSGKARHGTPTPCPRSRALVSCSALAAHERGLSW